MHLKMKNEDKLHVGWSKKYEENLKKVSEILEEAFPKSDYKPKEQEKKD